MAEDNTLGKLNDALFEQLDRLRAIDVSDKEALESEISRSKAVEGISKTVIDNSKVIMDAAIMRAQFSKEAKVPRLLCE